MISVLYVGPFVAALEYATDVKAEIVGKPDKAFFVEAMKSFSCEPHETIMIGDVSFYIQKCFVLVLSES